MISIILIAQQLEVQNAGRVPAGVSAKFIELCTTENLTPHVVAIIRGQVNTTEQASSTRENPINLNSIAV